MAEPIAASPQDEPGSADRPTSADESQPKVDEATAEEPATGDEPQVAEEAPSTEAPVGAEEPVGAHGPVSAEAASSTTLPTPTAEALPQITDPAYRDLHLSAYSLPKRTFAFETTLLGVAGDDLFAALGFQYGLGRGVQVGINIAHLGAGLINASVKWTFVETGPFAFSAQFSPVYLHGDWFWLSQLDQLFAGVDMVLLPLRVQGSFMATPWLQFDLSARYTGGFIVGRIATNDIGLDADIVTRQFALGPSMRIHLLGRSTLLIAADLPLYTAVPASVDTEVQLGPGIAAGGTLDGERTRSVDETYSIEVGVRSMVTKSVFLEFGLTLGPRTDLLYGSFVYPRLGVEARF